MLTNKKPLKIDDKEILTVIDKYQENKTKKVEENQTLIEGNENDYCKIDKKGKADCAN